VRTILRAILAVALLLGSGLADWAPAPVEQTGTCAHESCCCGCCGRPASAEDSCPCPKPEGNRGPAPSQGLNRAVAVAPAASRCTQGERRVEPRPEPATWAAPADVFGTSHLSGMSARGRDPDLGRHLARLNTFRI
jgi:hypothetical protein